MRPILIVEDDDLNRLMFAEFFAAMGYRPLSAIKALDAIALATQDPPLLILMDWRLPGNMDGLEATRILKANPIFRGTPILLISAHYETGMEARALQVGCAGFVRKPVDIKALRKLVESLVEPS